jgi:hypothetical protein
MAGEYNKELKCMGLLNKKNGSYSYMYYKNEEPNLVYNPNIHEIISKTEHAQKLFYEGVGNNQDLICKMSYEEKKNRTGNQ